MISSSLSIGHGSTIALASVVGGACTRPSHASVPTIPSNIGHQCGPGSRAASGQSKITFSLPLAEQPDRELPADRVAATSITLGLLSTRRGHSAVGAPLPTSVQRDSVQAKDCSHVKDFSGHPLFEPQTPKVAYPAELVWARQGWTALVSTTRP